MVSLSILGMTGWVNPFCLAMRRPWTLFVARRWSKGAFFVANPGVFDLWGLRHVGGGSRWSDAACEAPGRHTSNTMSAHPGCRSRKHGHSRLCWFGRGWCISHSILKNDIRNRQRVENQSVRGNVLQW